MIQQKSITEKFKSDLEALDSVITDLDNQWNSTEHKIVLSEFLMRRKGILGSFIIQWCDDEMAQTKEYKKIKQGYQETLSKLNSFNALSTFENNGWETEEFFYATNVLINEKPKKESLLKAIEELNELSLKLLHYVNKPEAIEEGDIEEEIADCEQHFHILKHYFPVSKKIRSEKIWKFLKSKDFRQYEEAYRSKLMNKE